MSFCLYLLMVHTSAFHHVSSSRGFINKKYKNQESVAGSVIQTTGTVEFEVGLRTGVLLGGCWYPLGGCTYPRINFRVRVGPGLGVAVRRTPFQTKF